MRIYHKSFYRRPLTYEEKLDRFEEKRELKKIAKARRESLKAQRESARAQAKLDIKQKAERKKEERRLAVMTSSEFPVPAFENVEEHYEKIRKQFLCSNAWFKGIQEHFDDYEVNVYDEVAEMTDEQLIDEDLLSKKLTAKTCNMIRIKLKEYIELSIRKVAWDAVCNGASRERQYEDHGYAADGDGDDDDDDDDLTYEKFGLKCTERLRDVEQYIREQWATNEGVKNAYFKATDRYNAKKTKRMDKMLKEAEKEYHDMM